MLKKLGFLIIIWLLLSRWLRGIEPLDEETSFMLNNVFFDCSLFMVYLLVLTFKDRFMFPSAIFILFFYVYCILGKGVWIFREYSWFNETGSPIEMARYFSIVGAILISVSTLNLWNFKFSSNIAGDTGATGSLQVSKRTLLYLIGFTFLGALLFTSGFTIIPILSSSMDESRVALTSQNSGGRGIGFLLLLFGVLGTSLTLFTLKANKGKSKFFYLTCIFLFTFFLALYSGRFLVMIPFVLYFIINQYGRSFQYSRILLYGILILGTFSALMYFGAIRYYGSDSTIDLIIRYVVADSFPEFRMSVYIDNMPEVNLFDQFFYTIIAGLFPGAFFSMVGIEKSDYFKPIGTEILDMTHFDPSSIPGIRTSLFGELSLTGMFMYIFILFLLVLLIRLDRSFFTIKGVSFRLYKILSFAIFLGFSIPYGSLFLVSVIEWYIIVLFVQKYFIDVRPRNITPTPPI
jgi:hypothetical protein